MVSALFHIWVNNNTRFPWKDLEQNHSDPGGQMTAPTTLKLTLKLILKAQEKQQKESSEISHGGSALSMWGLTGCVCMCVCVCAQC